MIISSKQDFKELKNSILALAETAKEAKKRNPEVINATIGMLASEDDSFFTFQTVKKVMADIDYDQSLSYSDTDGGEKYHEAIKTWLLGDTLPLFTAKKKISVIATPGGSGAIALTFQNYLDAFNKVLLPDVMWENYINFATERGASYQTYSLYDENGNFNLESLKANILSLYDQERILIVLNDPCENPTGFCMTDKDYDELVMMLNSFKDKKIILLMDVAYFDFYNADGRIVRNRYAKLTNLDDHVLTIFAFSGSKSFGLYGLRIGALLGVHRDEKEISRLHSVMEYSARSTWSNCSQLGLSIIKELVLNPKYNQMFKDEVKYVSSLLNERATAFLKEAKKVNLRLLPFECGFFVCVPTNDPVGLMNYLHRFNVYVVVTKTAIRIALCSISVKEASMLPTIIKTAIEEAGYEN